MQQRILMRFSFCLYVCRGGCIIRKRGNADRLICSDQYATNLRCKRLSVNRDIRKNTIRGSKILYCVRQPFRSDNQIG